MVVHVQERTTRSLPTSLPFMTTTAPTAAEALDPAGAGSTHTLRCLLRPTAAITANAESVSRVDAELETWSRTANSSVLSEVSTFSGLCLSASYLDSSNI